MTEWFENESFWKETYDFLFPEKLFEETYQQAEDVLKLINFQGSSVLDLCCGPGRFSNALAKKGLSVTGVDKSAFLLERAKEKARHEGLSVDWVLEDMRYFVRPSSYDLVLNMFTSFGYFDDKNDDLKVLENILVSLKPGGNLLIDVMGKETLARIHHPTISEVLDDGTILVQRPEIFDGWTRVRNNWIIIKGGMAKSFKFHHTIYSGQELKDRMELVGFEGIKLYGNFEGSPYDTNAERLIITGSKPLKKT